jgi:signal peptidase
LALARYVTLAVVTGDSMSPSVRRGDVCVVARGSEAGVGDVVVYRAVSGGRPVLHRVIDVKPDGTLATKGDANETPDAELVARDSVVGKVVRVVPLSRAFRLASGP